MADPSSLAGKVLWLRGKDLTGVDASNASGWADQSGAGHDATAEGSVSGSYSMLVRTGVTPAGGRALECRAGTQSAGPNTNANYMRLPSLGLTTAGEAWIVVQSRYTRQGLWHLSSSAGESLWRWSDGKVYESFGLSGTRQSFTPTLEPISNWRLYRVASDGTTWQAWIDNTSQATASSQSVGWSSAPTIGAGQNANAVDFRFDGYVAEVLVRDRVSTAGEVADLITYFNTEHGLTVPGGSPSTPTGSLAAVLPMPTVDLAGTVATPPVTGALASTLPALSVALTGDVEGPRTGALAAVLPMLDVSLTGEAAAPTVTGALAATLPMLSVAVTGDVAAPKTLDAISIRATFDAAVLSIPVPATPPAGVDPVPIVRYSHAAPALSALNPTLREGTDYPYVAPVEVGTLHVWVDGIDVTYLGGAPIQLTRWSSSTPAGDSAATFALPAMQPWDRPGVGAWSMLRPDAPVDVALVRTDGSRVHIWSGFLSADAADVGTSKTNGFTADGTLWQAGYTLHEPPHYLPPTDIGVLVADALNGVPGRRWSKIPTVTTGILTRNRGAGNQSVIQYVLDLLAGAWTDDGRQWTLVEVAPREYRIQLKEPLTASDAAVTFGAPGIEVDLSREQSTRVDVIYGRGVAPNGGRWRGTRFPGLVIAAPPPYPNGAASNTISVGDTDADTDTGTGVTTWQTRMVELGYALAIDGTYDASDATATRRLQTNAGLLVDGVVGPQTWAATFNRGPEGLDLTQWREPIAAASWTQPYLRDPAGIILGPNPAWDPTRIPHEIEVDFGPGITWSGAQPLARRMLTAESTPGLTGRVTLRTDPHTTSKIEIRPGSRLKVVGFQGSDVTVRVADVDGAVDEQGMTVTLTVDERSRDALSVAAILERNRAALPDPARRPGNPARDSRNTADRYVQWDVDSPCGVLPRTAVYGGLWTVPQPVPLAEVGRIAKIMLTATVPFTVALFGKAVKPSQVLAAVGDPHASPDPWTDAADTLDGLGWIESWGSQGQRCGYSPGAEDDGRAFTGRWEEYGSVDFVSAHPPYVWVALYSSTSGFIGGVSGDYGRFYPGTD